MPKNFHLKTAASLVPIRLANNTHSLAGSQIRPDVFRFDLVTHWPYTLHCGSCPKNPDTPSEKTRNVQCRGNLGYTWILRVDKSIPKNQSTYQIYKFVAAWLKLAVCCVFHCWLENFIIPKRGVRKSSPNT